MSARSRSASEVRLGCAGLGARGRPGRNGATRRDLDELLAHVRAVARERFEAGYDLDELQTAFSTLEEAIRREALARLPASELAWGLGLTDTALAHAKLALGRAFTSLAPRADAPSVDLTALFRRSDPGFEGRSATDLVYPV